MSNSPFEEDRRPTWTRAEVGRKFRLFMAMVDCYASVVMLGFSAMCTDDYDSSDCGAYVGQALIPAVMAGFGLLAHRNAERSLDKAEARAFRVTATVLLGIPFSVVVLFFLGIQL